MKTSLFSSIFFTIFVGIAYGFGFNKTNNVNKYYEKDPSSYGNVDQLKVNHMSLNLKTDFDRKVLSGYVINEIDILDHSAEELILDTKNLVIESIAWLKDEVEEVPLEFTFGETDAVFGQPLNVHFTKEMLKNAKVTIKINYETTPDCAACQWVEPSQTQGKVFPYLYTQCQTIYARSVVPCQDTPSNKLTYEAEIAVPKELKALMSAIKVGEEPREDGLVAYKFEQKMRIPTYLLALVVGNLKGVQIGPRTTVWSEPEYVDKAAYEFADTEKFIQVAEDYLFEYQWGVFDLLVLPPSFPYGGMENPCLTFVTPTTVAGDRSLVDVIAHELSHSWTGNLVTNSNWQHFWLNEGHTMYLERKIIAKLHGEEYRHFSAIIGWNDLKAAVDAYGKEEEYFTALVPDLRDKDPDDSFSTVPYEKGFNLLFHLEKILGGPKVFDPFLKSYVSKFANKSLSTNEWKDYLYSYFKVHDESKVKVLDSVDWNTWLYGYGMPPVDPHFDRTLLNICDGLAKKWIDKKNDSSFEGFSSKDIETFDAKQTMIFLSKIKDEGPYSKTFIEALDKAYEFSKTRNSEIRFLWQSLCLTSNYEPIYPAVVKFVEEQGRMKFTIPLYRMLYKCNKELAVSTFKKNINFYHPICADNIAKEFGLK